VILMALATREAHQRELADILRKHERRFIEAYAPSYHKIKVMRAITDCRTSALGGHKEKCSECGEERFSYNSCRNRHCPKCQFLSKERWIEKESESLLPIQYFHVVFTIPDDLRSLFLQNQANAYKLLFKAVKSTLLQLSRNEKYLGAQIGFLCVLHTWGQNLSYHPHIHCIVTGGGLNARQEWLSCRNNFFLPVRVLSSLFRGKLISYLGKAYRNQEIQSKADVRPLFSALRKKDWVVYCKQPFKNAKNVVNYLGRYTHRIALSNSRIISADDEAVSFSWRDYRDHNHKKVMRLDALEFIRRFCQHILPYRFMKIRHYGILSNRTKVKAMPVCRKILGSKPVDTKPPESWQATLLRIKSFDVTLCPICKTGHFIRMEILPAQLARPP